MANLYSGNLTNKTYEKLSELTGLTFTADTDYTVQVQTGEIFVREGTTGDGFLINRADGPFQFKQGESDLYVKITSGVSRINIAG